MCHHLLKIVKIFKNMIRCRNTILFTMLHGNVWIVSKSQRLGWLGLYGGGGGVTSSPWHSGSGSIWIWKVSHWLVGGTRLLHRTRCYTLQSRTQRHFIAIISKDIYYRNNIFPSLPLSPPALTEMMRPGHITGISEAHCPPDTLLPSSVRARGWLVVTGGVRLGW